MLAIHPWPARFRPPHFSFPFFQSRGPGSLDLFVLLETYLRAQGSRFPASVEKARCSRWCFGSLTQPVSPLDPLLSGASLLVLGGAGASQAGSVPGGHRVWASSSWFCPGSALLQKSLL